MSIGEVLSDARCRSGLSIGEVSRQTGIRAEIVWAIELDDFAKCGGNLYARGYIRSIAAAVFVDPAPLIAQFDATHPAGESRDGAGQREAAGARDRRGTRPHSGLLTLPEPDAPERPHPLTRSERYRRRHRRRVVLSSALCLAVLVIFGGEAYHFAHESRNNSENAAQAAFNRATTKHQPSKKAKPSASPTRTKPAHPKPSPSATPTVQTLHPVSARAYGPWGVTGDNPQDAGQAIDASSSTAWQSQWYSSASYGGLKTGTGLLVDFGRPVTIVSADLNFGVPGAYVQLRGANSPSASILKTIGGTKDAGTSTTIRPQEIPVRYILVWFTSLPPTSSGSYQASLYNISFQGHP